MMAKPEDIEIQVKLEAALEKAGYVPFRLEDAVALADQLKQDTGVTVDPLTLARELQFLLVFYAHTAGAQSPEARAAVKAAYDRCVEFREKLREAVDAGGAILKIGGAPGTTEPDVNCFIVGFPGKEELAAILANIEEVEQELAETLKCLDAIPNDPNYFKRDDPDYQANKTGRPRANKFKDTVLYLKDIYESHTGRSAGTSSSREADGRYGPFVRFVEAYLAFVGDSKRSALGESVKKILREADATLPMRSETDLVQIHKIKSYQQIIGQALLESGRPFDDCAFDRMLRSTEEFLAQHAARGKKLGPDT